MFVKVIYKLSSARQIYLHIGKIIIGQITWFGLGQFIHPTKCPPCAKPISLGDGKTASALRVPTLAG